MIKGTLIPIGGNEDKGNPNSEDRRLDFITQGILSRILKESGGTKAKIKVITTASRIPVKVGEMYTEAFGILGCQDVTILDIRKSRDANSQTNVDHIAEADCIMMSGGDQSRISDIIGGSKVHDLLAKRYREEAVVIAGTSAGAMAMSEEMISGGRSTEALWKGAVDMREGLGLIPGLIIDSHFIMRGRFGRLAEAVAAHPSLIGVGLAEDTGIIIREGKTFKVIGSGMVIVFDPSSLLHNNHSILPSGMPMTMTNLTVHVLANSDAFDIPKKSVEVLPIDADFE